MTDEGKPLVLDWTPPPGMSPEVASAWRSFYRKALRGDDGYKATPADYRLMYVAQKGRCWICRTAKGIHPDDPKGRGTRRLGWDHNHTTGQVRGLLCTGGDRTCNRIIGWLTAAGLARAAEYVVAPPARVLAETWQQVRWAEESGIRMTQADVDRLATIYLWPEDAQ